ncbi:MAG: BlaI/MecI/CopY family transcriptional regulator [Planctomycetaceae bacterium]|nr:BlaI/MecI/CopY family transcriptional regulator [Planctomycetaceae bacterium]
MRWERAVATSPSERELDILKVLWELGESRVRDVHEAMCPNGECAFTTVQTLLRIMAEKGLVSQRIEARTSYYAANYSPEDASSRFLHKVFDGAMDKLVLSMLSAEDLSAQELRDLEQMIVQARKAKQKKSGGK